MVTTKRITVEDLERDGVPDGLWELIDGRIVEVISPYDSVREVADKAAMWLEAGGRLVWVVDPRARTVAIHAAGRPVRVLTEADELDGGDVLPDFRVAVADLFQ
jgi:Uma2 family endonuclease